MYIIYKLFILKSHFLHRLHALKSKRFISYFLVLFDPWAMDNQVFFLPPTLYFSDNRKLFPLTAIILQRKQSQAECFCFVILKTLSR